MSGQRSQLKCRQGTLLSDECLQRLLGEMGNAEAFEVGVVVSHDCDIASAQERCIEVVFGFRREAIGANAALRNPRVLDMRIGNDVFIVVSLIASTKKSLVKEVLSDGDFQTDFLITPRQRELLQDWLAARYRRSVLSDSFGRRFQAFESRKLEKIVKGVSEDVEMVLYQVDGGEELEKEDMADAHKLAILIVHKEGGSEEETFAIEERVQRAGEKIEEKIYSDFFDDEMQSWKDIELVFCQSISIENLTYSNFLDFQVARFDKFSNADQG